MMFWVQAKPHPQGMSTTSRVHLLVTMTYIHDIVVCVDRLILYKSRYCRVFESNDSDEALLC